MLERLKNVSKGTIIRTAVLLLALVNTSLQLAGFEVLPFTPDEVEVGITVILNVGAALSAWYKNNSFSKEAIEADVIMREEKAKSKATRKAVK